ncbi:MAG: SCO family protein [Ignavibacteria bacterium]|nr:SCO family protein [Ignavibacteria bacterium]
MKNRTIALLGSLLVFSTLIYSSIAFAQDRSGAKPEVGIEEQLGTTIPADLEFYDEHGQIVTLGDLVNKPTILTLVFYRCQGICTPLLMETASIVDKMGLEPGQDYQILTLSFDFTEKPSLAQAKKFNFLKALEKKVPNDFWRFLTGDSANVFALTNAVGFYFKPEEDQFIHPGALIFLSPERKVTRYLLGITYLPFDVKMALMEASEGRTGPTIAKLLKFCYTYDAEGRTYAMNITRIAGIGILLLIGVFVTFVVLKPKRARN